ncbi:hypothetical protein FQN55_002765 [Onygenales sp. PD_40]|nr:hypothetical protein FQN55_002765 [Onygenales sp. PD_40]
MPDASQFELHAPPPPPAELQRDAIKFLHPGYQEPRNNLLSLPRVDRAPASHAFGVHHRTALVACQIIGNNAFGTGRLWHDKDGQQPVTIPLDGVLTDPSYYFLVGAGPSNYPIVPSFQDWQFPHGCIPDAWGPLSGSSAPTGRCGITNFSICTKEAHLVPKEEEIWFSRNGMDQYGTDLGDINDSANLILLRSDIHRSFDNRWFAIVPKVAGGGGSPETDTDPLQYVSHILSKGAAEYWPTCHNTMVQGLRPDSHPYLFARFAWAILRRVKPFLTAGVPRNVIRLQASNRTEDIETVWNAELLTGARLKSSYSGGGSRGAVPKKRRLESGSFGENDDLTESSGGSDAGMGNYIWDNVMDEWEARGQRKHQQISSVTPPEMIPEVRL